MQLALRPYVTTGVALVGASVIAVTPITPTPAQPQAQSHAVQLSAAVQTLSNTNPPSPINVLAIPSALPDPRHYGPLFAKALQNYVEALATYLTTSMPAGLRDAFGQLVAGDITGAAYTFLITVNGAIMVPGFQMMPVLSLPGDMLDDMGLHNLAAAVDSVIGITTLWPLLGAVTGPMFGAISAFAAGAQAIYDAIGAGNPVGAMTELLKLPLVTVDAFINGYEYYRGLLTQNQYGKGLIPSLMEIVPRAISLAFGMAPSGAALAVAATSSAETPADTLEADLTEAVTVDSGQVTPKSETNTEAASADVESATETAEAVADSDVTQTPEEAPGATTEGTTTDEAEAEADPESSGPIVRDSIKAVPGTTDVTGPDTGSATDTTSEESSEESPEAGESSAAEDDASSTNAGGADSGSGSDTGRTNDGSDSDS